MQLGKVRVAQQLVNPWGVPGPVWRGLAWETVPACWMRCNARMACVLWASLPEELAASCGLESAGQSPSWSGTVPPISLKPPKRGTVHQPGAIIMPEPTKQEIEARAYKLWEQAGRPEDRETEFWQLAEQELRNEDRSSPTRTPDTL